MLTPGRSSGCRVQCYPGSPQRDVEAPHPAYGGRGQRPAGVTTRWHQDPDRLRGAQQYQLACTRAGSTDSTMAPKQGTPPWEAASPLHGDQRGCGDEAMGSRSGQRSEGAASTGQGSATQEVPWATACRTKLTQRGGPEREA